MEEKREHLRQIDVRQCSTSQPGPDHQDMSHKQRSLCLICGKIEKTPGTGSFYRIFEETIDCYGGRGDIIAKRLTEILGFNFENKKKFLASQEVCKKCLRTTTEVVRMEEQLRRNKEELVSNFFTTTSKFKNKGSQNEDSRQSHLTPSTSATPTNGVTPGQAPVYPAPFPVVTNGYPFPPMVNSNTTPFLVQPMPLSFLNQHKHLQYNNGIVQFYQSQPYSAIRHSNDVAPPPVVTEPSKEPGDNVSEATPSEVGSSCYMAVSPLPKSKHHRDEIEEDSCCSPRPFDTQSYASTFSFRSTSSIRSKAEIKSYDEPISLEIEKNDQTKLEPPKRKCESNDTSPRSQTSPVSTTSPKPDSLDSNSPRRSPDVDKDRDNDRMKPWKKRKIVHESGGSGDSQGESASPDPVNNEKKSSEGSVSPDCQTQVDQSNSDKDGDN